MAVLTGTATSAQNFLAQLNTFLVSNGWNLLRGNPAVDPVETWFTWQGPGFDAVRRPYVHLRAWSNTSSLTDQIEIRTTPGNNNSIDVISLPDSQPSSVWTMLSLTGFTFWVYLDGLRIVAFFRNEGANYTSMYAGFFTPFALPSEYPFPLLSIGNSAVVSSLTFDTFRRPHIFDPVSSAGYYRRWDNTWRTLQNRSNTTGSTQGSYETAPQAFTFPFHSSFGSGSPSASTWPNALCMSSNQNPGHAFQQFRTTNQGELPMFPIILGDNIWGAVGSLHNLYAIPGGGVLVPEQTITRSGDDYRIFPSRDNRTGRDWGAVKEV